MLLLQAKGCQATEIKKAHKGTTVKHDVLYQIPQDLHGGKSKPTPENCPLT